jgi:MFS family permease
MQRSGLPSEVALFMALLITGGMCLQYPVGKISDLLERRLVLIFLSIGICIVALTLTVFFQSNYLVYGLLFLFGGLTFTLYPVSISYSCDNLDKEDLVPGTQGVLLAYSVGATAGPFIAPQFIHFLGINGLFIYIACICVILAVFLGWRKLMVAAKPNLTRFIAVPRTSPITSQLYPKRKKPKAKH